MIISFAWTTEALLAGRKTVTRRDWNPAYAARFRAGTVHDAYDRLPRVHGKKVGDVKISEKPYPEPTREMPDSDFESEGLVFMEERGLLIRGIKPREWFDRWRESNQILFVVRFGLVFPCQRCGSFSPNPLCSICWHDWIKICTEKNLIGGTAEFDKVYKIFCATVKSKGGNQ